MKKINYFLLLLASVLFFFINCSMQDEDKLPPFQPPEDLRKQATPPSESEIGVNFSVQASDARYVSIVGDFNNWIDNRNVMTKNKYGVWSITMPLKKGTYSYKFNIDGVWIIDSKNPDTVKNSLEDIRSVIKVEKDTKFYTQPVYLGFTEASPPQIISSGVQFTFDDKFANRVSVAGTFNNWDQDGFYMSKNQNGIWSIVLPLPRGKYYYKFNVDGLWKHDTQNPLKEDDGQGEFKSYIEVKYDVEDLASAPFIIDYQIVRFEYVNKDLPSYIDISVVGDFNDWRDNVNVMSDSDNDKEWFTTVRLGEGEYYYNFSLEGKQFNDPDNPSVKTSPQGIKASFLKIIFPPNQVNVKFSYKNDNAKQVYLVGDFNSWNPQIDPMKKDQKGLWYITKFLPIGKYSYQFIVDGSWILDPNNPSTVVDSNEDSNSFLIIGEK
ncbi:MAG: hypothetical protein JW827_01850 [Spirochaetes bacterium]|nr:hypothetical protein [Spirochaetota bacterium]